MYTPAVRVGNWIEDVALEKEKASVFMKKQQSEKLLIQQTRRLFGNLLKETHLSRNNGFLQFGSCIQLKAPDMPRFPPSIQLPLPKSRCSSSSSSSTNNNNNNNNNFYDNYGLVMAGTIHEKHIGTISNFVNDCRLIASPIHVPCTCNCFVIQSAECYDRTGENVLFGQEFVLQIVNANGERLYVRAEKPLVDEAHGPLEHNPLVLSNKKDRYSIWKVLHWNKNMRFESEGAPFPPFTRIAMRHLMSGLDLAVEGTVWRLGIFGTECGMSVHTYVDSSNQESAECAWMFVTRK